MTRPGKNKRIPVLTFHTLATKIKDRAVYMLIGNGSKNQFRHMGRVKALLRCLLKGVPPDSVFLYFGDPANKKKPDVGLLFPFIKEQRPDIEIFMIQINKAREWGVPSFVTGVYWHKDYTEACTWGGIYKGLPCSNTKKWVSLNRRIRGGIQEVFILGGGEITLDEFSLIQKHHIPYVYFPVERKYKGDGKTRVRGQDSVAVKVGVTYHRIP